MGQGSMHHHKAVRQSVRYYLTHHAVLREDKATTKLRVVFNASSHEDRSPSLNDCIGVFWLDLDCMKFHIWQTSRKHFCRFHSQKDQDAVRFLWFTGPPTEEKDMKLHMLRMLRVVFGASLSPFLLAATIRKHLRQYELEHPQVVNPQHPCGWHFKCKWGDRGTVTTTAKKIISAAGMELCKWMTNSKNGRRARWIALCS